MSEEIRRFEFVGLHGRPAACGLRRIDLPDGRVVVIATELDDNPGVSVTNFAEELATIVCQALSIDPRKLVWIEHYPPVTCPSCHGTGGRFCRTCRGVDRQSRSTWDLVTFTLNDFGEFIEPDWRPMSDEDWAELGVVRE